MFHGCRTLALLVQTPQGQEERGYVRMRNTATFNFSYSINGFMRTYLESVGQNSADGQRSLQRRSRYGASVLLLSPSDAVQSHIKEQQLPRHAGNQYHSRMYLLLAVSLAVIAAAKRTYVTLSSQSTRSSTPNRPRSVSPVVKNTWGNLADNFVNGERCFLSTDCVVQAASSRG